MQHTIVAFASPSAWCLSGHVRSPITCFFSGSVAHISTRPYPLHSHLSFVRPSPRRREPFSKPSPVPQHYASARAAMDVSVLHLIGASMQSVALGILAEGDANTSWATRAVGTIVLALVFAVGTVVATLRPSRILAVVVPVVRADLTLTLIARVCNAMVWAVRLSPTAVLYENEVFPVQVAAMIWNDCKFVPPHTRAEDEGSVLVDLVDELRELWRPAPPDTPLTRIVRLPVYFVLVLASEVVRRVDAAVIGAGRVALGGRRNVTPLAIEGEAREATGHTLLVSRPQLRWIQGNLMIGGNQEELREARRVLLRALHIANLMDHGGHSRLHEHACAGHAMSEYYSMVTNPVVKSLLSSVDRLMVLTRLSNGNALVPGDPIPRQVLWARLIVGSQRGLRGEGRWRGPVASAIFTVARENSETWGAGVTRTAMQRHVYSVSRRWLVDWVMHTWWEVVDLSNGAAGDDDAVQWDDVAFFERLRTLWTGALTHNARSLPHAVGELVVSQPRAADIEGMLVLLLGADWELWTQQARTASGLPVGVALLDSGEWQCVGREVLAEDAVSSVLYDRVPYAELVAATAASPLADQVRGTIVARIVDTLVTRIQTAWQALPSRSFQAADVAEINAEY